MSDAIHTLQEFMLHTETITYIIMAVSLLAILGFWLFLNGRESD